MNINYNFYDIRGVPGSESISQESRFFEVQNAPLKKKLQQQKIEF